MHLIRTIQADGETIYVKRDDVAAFALKREDSEDDDTGNLTQSWIIVLYVMGMAFLFPPNGDESARFPSEEEAFDYAVKHLEDKH